MIGCKTLNEARIERALDQATDDLDFDSYPKVSETDDGAWIEAWVYISNEEMGFYDN